MQHHLAHDLGNKPEEKAANLTFGSLLGKIFQLQLYRLLLAEQRQILANHDHNTRENLEALSLKLNTPILEFCCRPHLEFASLHGQGTGGLPLFLVSTIHQDRRCYILAVPADIADYDPELTSIRRLVSDTDERPTVPFTFGKYVVDMFLYGDLADPESPLTALSLAVTCRLQAENAAANSHRLFNVPGQQDMHFEDIDIGEGIHDDVPVVEESKPTKAGIRAALYASLRVWQAAFNISITATLALLTLLNAFIQLWFFVEGVASDYILLEPPHAGDGVTHASKQMRTHKDDEALGIIDWGFCPTCYQTYPLKECYTRKRVPGSNGGKHRIKIVANLCTNHVMKPRGKSLQTCGTSLGVARNLQFAHAGRLTTCSIWSQLDRILKRPGIVALCNEWKTRNLPEGVMGDVYEGKMWKEWSGTFFRPPQAPANSLNLGFMFNIDWFQPYKYSQLSCGVAYCVILNLPRRVRYKRENVLVVAFLPDTAEHTISTLAYAEPFAKEMLELWNEPRAHLESDTLVRCAVICFSCDLPAGRSICGFMGVNAINGCSRCKKDMRKRVMTENKDYFQKDGENLQNLTVRTNEGHREAAKEWKQKPNKSQRAEHAKSNGARWSPLLMLPYINMCRMLVVDPMHNFFLGLVRHTIDTILGDKKSNVSVKEFANAVGALKLPHQFGRLMTSSAFDESNQNDKQSGKLRKLTSEEWQTFAISIGDPIFKYLLPSSLYTMWRHLTEAIRGSCRYVLDSRELPGLQKHLYLYLTSFHRNFGGEAIRPNHHFAQELILRCIPDFGPSHVFWCYAFERLNGILGAMPHNNRDISKTLLRQFMVSHADLKTDFPFLSDRRFETTFEKIERAYVAKALKSNLETLSRLSCLDKYLLLQQQGKVKAWQGYEAHPSCLVSATSSAKKFEDLPDDKFLLLQERFELTAQSLPGRTHSVSRRVTRYSKACIFETHVGSAHSQSERSSFILSSFREQTGENEIEFAGQIQSFYEVEVTVEDKKDNSSETRKEMAVMAFVRWYKMINRGQAGGHEEAEHQTAWEPDAWSSWLPLMEIGALFVHVFNPKYTQRFSVARYPIVLYI